MLTADLVRPRLRARGGELTIDRVRVDDPHWRQTAAELIALLETYHGHTRDEWEDALADYEGDRVDYDVIRGLAKVLTDEATFTADEFPADPATIREAAFAHGPAFSQPILFQPATRAEVLTQVGERFGMEPEQVEAALFADLSGAYRLVDTGGAWTAEELLARYNLELARGVLYWARSMHIQLFDGYKDFWRYMKLFKLMFWAEPIDGGYDVLLDGPISPFVKSTTRYGRQFAAFLPALLLGQRWQMEAEVSPPGYDGWLTYRLNNHDPLPSVFKRSGEFDSQMEADFAAEFHEKFGDERSGWSLHREDEVILLGDTVFIPDFTLIHEDGRRAIIEIMGFWHPDYLRRKLAKVRQADRSNLILLVYESINLSAQKLKDVPAEVLYFVRKPILKDVMPAVERMAVPG